MTLRKAILFEVKPRQNRGGTKNISHPASHWICGVRFYIVILLARINAPIQALLWQGFGIPSENRKVKSHR